MKRILTFLTAALSAISLYAQSDLSYKEWKDGPLTLEDFSQRKSSGKLIGQISTGIQTYPGDWEKVNWNLRVKRLRSKTVFDPITSWVRSDTLTDQAVRYGQLLFDATELTRRKMQNHLAAGKYETSYQSIVKRYFAIMDGRIQEIESVTDEGKNLAELEIQEQNVAEEMAALEDLTGSLPEYTFRKFAIGFHVGAASQFHVGNYASVLSPAYGMMLGWNFGIGRSAIYFDMAAYAGAKIMKDIHGDGINVWKAGEKVNSSDYTLQYAYDVYDGNTFRISPFAGVGVAMINYNNPVKDAKPASDVLGGFRILAGVSCEFKYLRSLYLAGDPVWSSVYGGLNEHSLRLKVYIARTQYSKSAAPCTINCSLTFNLLSKYIKP